jgi:hypothetical protein
MTRSRIRGHRLLVLAVALLAALPITPARGQSRPNSAQADSAPATSMWDRPARAHAESIAVLPAVHVPLRTIGASIGTIDSAEIVSSGARTLSELLLARVPGLSVRRRGGTEMDGSEVRARGMTSSRGAKPMLIVDGIVVGASQALPVPGTSVALSHLDDLTPADVRRIDVLRGPAAAALYGPGAVSGVIVVTTQRGGEGPLRLDVAGGAGLTDVRADFPANYQLTSGAPQQLCNPKVLLPQPAGCRPTTLYQWNPLEQASPFRVGRATSGRVTISGTTLGTRLFAGVSAERAGGITTDERQSRFGVRGSVDRALPGGVTVSARGSYLERGASVPARGNTLTADNVTARGLIGAAYDDSTRGYRSPFPPIESRIAEPSITRVTSALRFGWQPRSWLTMDALGGQDRARESGIRTARYMQPPDTIQSYQANADYWTSGTLHLGMEARYAAGERLTLATYMAYDDVRTHDRSLDSVGSRSSNGLYGYSWSRYDVPRQSQAATVRQHLGWGEVFDVNTGARWEVGRGVSAPFGANAYRNIDASLRLPAFRPGLDLRLRAAAGYAPFAGPEGYVPERLSTGRYVQREVWARQGERELGIDAAFGGRARLSLTYFSAHARNVFAFDLPTSQGLSWPVFAEVSNRGLEALASAYWLDGPSFGWRTTVTVATLHSRATSDGGLRALSGVPADGYPLQGHWNVGYHWSDANGDGIITANEVQFDTAPSYVGPSTPTLEIGLHNFVTLPGRMTVGSLLDYRGGQYRDNQTEALRCQYLSCRGVQDPTLPLEEQARWMAVMRGAVMRGARAIEPASFLRLREVVLEWTVPASAARAIGAERLTARVVGQNLGTWTRYGGIDPEVGEASVTGWEAPVDLLSSPLSRRVLVELRVGTGVGTR